MPDLTPAELQTMRAHLYASFHSGRQESPNARQTLKTVSGVSQRSQAAYEKRAGVKAKGQIAWRAIDSQGGAGTAVAA